MSNSIYLVLDMMNDLVHEEGVSSKGPYGEQVRSRKVVENTKAAIEKARAAGIPVGFVRVGFSPDYRECPPNSPIFNKARDNNIFKLGEWGTETHPKLGQTKDDIDIVKHRVSPFYATTLEAVLSAKGITRIYCSGISTNAVVQATVRDGHDRDFEMVVLDDCCCGLTTEEHEIAMKSLERFCKTVTSTTVEFE